MWSGDNVDCTAASPRGPLYPWLHPGDHVMRRYHIVPMLPTPRYVAISRRNLTVIPDVLTSFPMSQRDSNGTFPVP